MIREFVAVAGVVLVLGLGLGLGLGMSPGCAAGRGQRGIGEAAATVGAARDEALAAHAARVAQVPVLWARTVTTIWYPGETGEEQSDQAEGHFNYRAPKGLVLTFGKVGEIGAVLGSNADQYWWAELRDPKRALVGRHVLATPERVRELGLPVHPLDLIELTGLSPITGDGVSARLDPSSSRVIVEGPTRWGVRSLWIDRQSGEVSRVELRDDAGRLLLFSELSRYTTPRVVGAGAPPAFRVPGEMLVALDGDRVRARIMLSEPEIGGSRPRGSVFDFETWTRSYGVREIVDIDAGPASARASSGGAVPAAPASERPAQQP